MSIFLLHPTTQQQQMQLSLSLSQHLNGSVLSFFLVKDHLGGHEGEICIRINGMKILINFIPASNSATFKQSFHQKKKMMKHDQLIPSMNSTYAHNKKEGVINLLLLSSSSSVQ